MTVLKKHCILRENVSTSKRDSYIEISIYLEKTLLKTDKCLKVG